MNLKEASKRIIKRYLFNYHCWKLSNKTHDYVTRIAIFTFLGENWNSFITMYEDALSRADVNIDVYVFPKSVRGKLDLILYRSTLEFFKKKHIDITPAYIEETDDWIDLDGHKWDFVFFDEPYDVFWGRFSITNMYKHARICYIPYGYSITDSEKMNSIVMPETFFCYVSYFFKSTDVAAQYMKHIFNKVGNRNHHIVDLGYPRFDLYSFDYTREHYRCKTVLWIPRYTLPDINMSDPSAKTSFFDFKDKITSCANEDNNNFEWIIRPHPSAFTNFVKHKIMTESEVNNYLGTIKLNPHTNMDTDKDYRCAFNNSDVLLADFSSLIVEYILTGKPVIYCGDLKAINDNRLLEAMYCVSSWEDALRTLKNLAEGNDTLFSKRKEYAASVNKSSNAGCQILDYLVEEHSKHLGE